jgi:tRNA pseudouridine55 synthase
VTDTQDISGKVLETHEVNVTEEDVRSAIMGFTGKQMQLPPMYSALKVGGKKLVDLAREGREVERKEREVEFSDIEIHRVELPHVEFSVTCSHGAYIRTLCHDAGSRLGCGACMESLLRTRVEEFTLDQAMTLSQLSAAKEAEDAAGTNPSAYSFVLAPDRFYQDLPAAVINSSFEQALLNGRPALCRKVEGENIAGLPDGSRVRMYLKSGDFVGIYRRDGGLYRLETFFYELS